MSDDTIGTRVLLSETAVMRYLRLSRGSVREILRDVPRVKLRHQYRWDKDDVDRAVESRKERGG